MRAQDRQMKVLFLIQWYPSRHSANINCDDKIMQALLHRGDEVHCLADSSWGAAREETVNGVRVHRFFSGFWYKLHTLSRDHPSCWTYRPMEMLNRLILRFKQVLTAPIYPFYDPIICLRFAHAALRLQKKESFDFIVAEYNGNPSLYAGYRVKKSFPETPFLPILWDPLTGKTPARYLPRSFAQRRLRLQEKLLLSRADAIACMRSSRAYHQANSTGKSYYPKMRFLDIPGIEPPRPSSVPAPLLRKDAINVVFAGVLSLPDRDPTPILRILNRTALVERLHVLFLCTGSGRDKVETMRSEFRGELTIHGYLSGEELNAVYQGADLLLNLGGPNPSMVPSKIFTYLSYGKPILSTYYIDGESSQSYLDCYENALCVDLRADPAENARAVEAFLRARLGTVVPFETVSKQFPENTAGAFTDLIDSIKGC